MTWENSFYEISVVAGRQYGLVTAAQVERVGVAPGDLDLFSEAGLIWEHDWSVYQLASAPLSFQRASMCAAWLALRPRSFAWERPSSAHEDAVLSHGSAARFLGLGAVSEAGVSFTFPGNANLEALRAVTVHTAPLAPEDIVVSDGIPVTTPHRTIIDLVQGWADPDEVGRVMADAVRRDLVDVQTLHTDLAPFAERYDLPTDGRRFVELLLRDLPFSALSPRNLSGYVQLRYPDQVARVRRELIAAFPGDTSEGGTDLAVLTLDEDFTRRICAETVGRAELHG